MLHRDCSHQTKHYFVVRPVDRMDIVKKLAAIQAEQKGTTFCFKILELGAAQHRHVSLVFLYTPYCNILSTTLNVFLVQG